MGTEIQSKMYLPGYYTTPTLTTNVGHSGWSLLNENKSVTNEQPYNILSMRPVVNGLHECSKEQVRQMILKHESIFKYQLNELHRLYERQKHLVNEIKSKELLKLQNAAAASQLPLFLSGFPLVGSGHHRPAMSTIAIISHSYFNPIGNIQPTSIVPSQARVKRRLFDLELPADQYSSDGEEPEEVLSGPSNENYPRNVRNEAKVSFVHPGGPFGDNKDALSSGLDKMSVSTDDVYRDVWPFAKKFPEKPLLGNNGGISNLHLKNDSNQKEWFANATNADQTRNFGGSCGLLDIKKTNAPSPSETRKACEPAKRTLFGIDISDRGLNSSYQASKSDVATMSESPPTWERPPSSVRNNWTSVELSHQKGSFFSSKLETNQLHSNLPSIAAGFPYADSIRSSLNDFPQPGSQWNYPIVGCKGSKADAKPSTNVKGDTLQKKPHWLEEAANNSSQVGILKADSVHDLTPQFCTEKLKMQSDKACSRNYIDLNTCLTEEETQIDMQVSVAVARDVNIGEASEERIYKEPFQSSHDEPIRVAAETLVAMLSSKACEMQENAADSFGQEISACREDNMTMTADSLMWFAEIASSNEQGQTVNVVKVNGASISIFDEDSSLDSMDHFEYMTLNLVQTELEEFCNATSDNPKEEVSLSNGPQRGRTRRGRQKKNFQRDVLSGIACLSRNEVTEDLETFEGSIRAIGGSWKSGLSHRNSGRGRGRKCSGTCTTSPTSTIPSRTFVQAAVSPPQMEQQPRRGELQELEKRSMAVTGKRTRRPPRQRYPIHSSPDSQKYRR